MKTLKKVILGLLSLVVVGQTAYKTDYAFPELHLINAPYVTVQFLDAAAQDVEHIHAADVVLAYFSIDVLLVDEQEVGASHSPIAATVQVVPAEHGIRFYEAGRADEFVELETAVFIGSGTFDSATQKESEMRACPVA